MKAPERQELQKFYSQKSQEELLQLAADASSLTEDAKYAISAELQRRGLTEEDLRPYRQALEQGQVVKAQRGEALAKKFQLPKRFQWVWPTIVDEASARKAAKNGFGSCMFVAGASFLVGLLSLLGVKIGNFDSWIIVDASLFAIIGWRIYRLSRAWSVMGLLLFLAEVYYKVALGEKGGIGVITVILLLGFVAGVRGTFAFPQFHREHPSSS